MASSKNQLAVLLGTYNSRVELTLPKASVFEKTPTVPVGLDVYKRQPPYGTRSLNALSALSPFCAVWNFAPCPGPWNMKTLSLIHI